jgi:hypothetical protein
MPFSLTVPRIIRNRGSAMTTESLPERIEARLRAATTLLIACPMPQNCPVLPDVLLAKCRALFIRPFSHTSSLVALV